MAKTPHKRIGLAQNFLVCPQLVRSLVQDSALGALDLVYEIGPGQGIITQELARTVRQVYAIEKDQALVKQLQKQFQYVPNVQIIARDFLHYHIRAREYKLFANIPYNITASIMHKIIDTAPGPASAHLIMQAEAAAKFAGNPIETQCSILAKPLFDFQIMRTLRRTDFDPVPSVDSVLLHIQRRALPLIGADDSAGYQAFVRFGFGGWKKSLKLTFKSIFTYPQWKQLSKDLSFALDATPSQLTFEQWLGLYHCFKSRVPSQKQAHVDMKRHKQPDQ